MGNELKMSKEKADKFNIFKDWIKNLVSSDSQQAIMTLERWSKKLEKILLLFHDELLVCLRGKDSTDWEYKGKYFEDNEVLIDVNLLRERENVFNHMLSVIEKHFWDFQKITILDTPSYYLKEGRSRASRFFKAVAVAQAKDMKNMFFVFLKGNEIKKYILSEGHFINVDDDSDIYNFRVAYETSLECPAIQVSPQEMSEWYKTGHQQLSCLGDVEDNLGIFIQAYTRR